MDGTENFFRVLLGTIVAVGFGISAWFRGRADRLGGRVCRREDGPIAGLALLGSGLAAVAGLGAYLLHPAWMAWARLDLPAWLRLAGLPLGAAGLALSYWVFRTLGPNVTPTGQLRRRHTLVTEGPYRHVRHPMYSSAAVVFTAYFLLAANWFIGASCTATLAILALRAPSEERNLAARFGEEYRRYARRTPRFVPRRAGPAAQDRVCCGGGRW